MEDKYLGKWLKQQLNTTMGACPRGSEPTAMAQGGGPAGPMTQATFAADIGKGVTLGLKALRGPISPGNLAQGTTKEGNEKTRYTDNDIAAIMGFSHVHRGDQVQPILTMLNNAKQKILTFSAANS